ncbi:histidinol-phosphate aminotransferase [Multifurca ochricompacta]|uniref:histidinol-phosphate transaminase n=1 Tax=Multifurca ochricompacta TaxID=376703 RepID=A0AAD4MA05_9AGAM|nr:histidinol-phosphate aminotransferase [Multifurca ochricompacta]
MNMGILGLVPSLTPTRPAHFDIERVIRPNILALHPYRCARDDYSSGILLDANENALGHSIAKPETKKPSSNKLQLNGGDDFQLDTDLDPILALDLHRYPDPSHPKIKSRIAEIRGLPSPDHVFLGVGSDEVIDLLMRVCVAPGSEKILITPPTYGMYAVCAQVNDVGIVKVNLELSASSGEGGDKGRFSLRVDEVKKAIDGDQSIKLIFLCSPGNPTGTLISLASIRTILDYEPFKGIVVIDEAYIDFSEPGSSAVTLIAEYANLCVMQTLSKSFGLAAIRLGIALAQPPLIQILTNTKAPYNVSTPAAHLALRALSPESLSSMRKNIETLKASRAALLSEFHDLKNLGLGHTIGAQDANFILIPVLARDSSGLDNVRAHRVYKTLAEEEGVVVRYRGGEPGCLGCLRITVGTEVENAVALKKLKKTLERL